MIIDATWLWRWMLEGLAVTGVIAVVFALRPAASAATRSLVWWTALLAVAGLPWFGALASGWIGGGWLSVAGTPAASVTPPPALDLVAPVATTLLVALWAVATSIGMLRLIVGVITLRRWRARCRPIDPASLDHLTGWRTVRDTGRRAAVVMSPDVASPCVLGLWSPRIALPPSALTMRADALDAVLVHECAHVQRRDDLAQFVQHVVVAVLALHPAVWWIDRMLTVEREAACDDWVVMLAAPRQVYTTWLLSLAADRRTLAGPLPVGIAGGGSQLARRVRRLADRRRTRQLRTAWRVRLFAPVSVAVLACLCGGEPAAALRLPDAGPLRQTDVEPWPVRRVDLPARIDERPDTRVSSVPVARAVRTEGTPVDDAAAPLDAVHPLAVTAMTRAAAPVTSRTVPVAAPDTAPSRPAPAALAVTGLAPDVTPAWNETGQEGVVPQPSPHPLRQVGVAIGDAGVVAGQGVARGGITTGEFFARLGKRVARSF